MSANDILPYKPCPKCGSTNLGFGSGIDALTAFLEGVDKAKTYTYTICHNCGNELCTWQKTPTDESYKIRNIEQWNNGDKNED